MIEYIILIINFCCSSLCDKIQETEACDGSNGSNVGVAKQFAPSWSLGLQVVADDCQLLLAA